jgi:transcriptional regulator with GAF, ATPase, and Fis domain
MALGGGESPVIVTFEAGMAAFAPPAHQQRTVLASAPLADLRTFAPDDLIALAGRAMSARTLDDLAEAALPYLRSLFPHATGHAVLVAGASETADAGDPLPGGLHASAMERREVALLQGPSEPLPDTTSIARTGMRAAVLAPLLAGETWHGLLAAWSAAGDTLLPRTALGQLSVAALLVGLAAEAVSVRREGEVARERLEREARARNARDRFVEPVGQSPAFVKAVSLCREVAPSAVPVVLSGETGTGKEVLARLLHRSSRRADRPFVAFNCAALPETLLESELFGHVRGAFTGAMTDRPGLFEEAHGGTVFLDEIGEMPLPTQAKLLRVLQDGEVRRIGSNRPSRVDIRVVSATNRDLGAMVKTGAFRMDLYYRLNSVTIVVPPLRERGEDVTLLAHWLLGEECGRSGRRIPGFTPEALAALKRHGFPGNVRELANEVSRAVALTRDGMPVGREVLSEGLTQGVAGPHERGGDTGLREAVGDAERQVVEAALARAGGNFTQAARDLGISRQGLYKMLDRLGIR